MRWSSFYNLHIHTILHLNKTDDQVRGHIGTELTNKAETVLQVTKSAFDGNISEVKPMQVRELEFAPFAFRINDDGLPVLVKKYSFEQERQATKDMVSDEDHAKALAIVFANGSVTGFKELIESIQKAYASIGYKRGRNVCIEIYKYLVNQGVIEKNNRQYSLNQNKLNVNK
jgi:hypothetical protein